jgi:hypothetical protein
VSSCWCALIACCDAVSITSASSPMIVSVQLISLG